MNAIGSNALGSSPRTSPGAKFVLLVSTANTSTSIAHRMSRKRENPASRAPAQNVQGVCGVGARSVHGAAFPLETWTNGSLESRLLGRPVPPEVCFAHFVAPAPYPHPTSSDVSLRMRANRKHDTKPEVAVRSLLHARGFRFRKHYAIRLPERTVRPDIVFTRARLAVFIDGCFWHACPLHGTEPKANTNYWRPKLRRNVERDRAVDAALEFAGWRLVRAWEHEHPADVAARVAAALDSAASATD